MMEKLSNRNVFLVEDNAFYATLLKNELSSFCGNVSIFTSGEACLENMSLRPDVVLLDYNLEGGMTGIEVLKKIKEQNQSLPVVFISGSYKLEVVKDALRLGAEDFIDKKDTGLLMVESRLKNIFQQKTIFLEQKINKMAKRITLSMFMLMIIAIVLLFVFFSK